MGFLDEIVAQAWARAKGRCECERATCKHTGFVRCAQVLSWAKRGAESADGWEAHHRSSEGDDNLANCEILCQYCHKGTETFGAH